ncbi:putative quinol monooxygenase [Mucilaginibacter sp. OK283]|jgi:quinol monooxygenase YgiN|uniref:putative quinol monooxygenase n=1 Tax=Mucilaginibacter sp. OK283 TaxID=1881049 RepID=UPI0008AFF875|nr:antibiotic biosynthesis monooxygenase [Mucilaginibacter sp. OK283]SEP40229.1 Quinol monooxygenase YgiN [Mucilaginibacter sp. OK283]
MVKLAILAKLEAKPGKENELAELLINALPLVQQELGTVSWYALKLGPTTFGIFDTFESEESRQTHLSGKLVAALMSAADDLFEPEPSIELAEIIAFK